MNSAELGSYDMPRTNPAQLLMKTFAIPQDHIFSSRDLTFVKGVMRMTNGQGVDLVLNSLSGEVSYTGRCAMT